MDYGHKIADDELKKLEKRIAKEYERAYKEVRKKTDNYFKTFKKQDAQKAKDVKDGILSQKDYKDWRHNKMLTGKRWRDLSTSIAYDYIHSTEIADYMIKEHSFDVYAKNFNFGTFEVEKGAKVDTMFTLYDKDTVERLIKDDPKLLPDPGKELRRKIKSGEVKRWELKQVQSVATQSIIQGESISGISRRIAKDLGERNLHSSVRTARTMTTCAENAGRVDSYKRAENLGIDLEQRWMATLDDRTRHTHAAMDGETQPIGEEFSNGCEYPGDPAGEPEEVYNCRCTLVADVKGTKFSEDFERRREDKTIGNMSYSEWKKKHIVAAEKKKK